MFRTTFLAILALIPAMAASGQEMKYAPGTTRYEQTLVATMAQDFMGSGAGAELSMMTRLSAAISRPEGSRDSLSLAITVDSSAMNGGAALGGQTAPIAKGTRVQRNITPLGKMGRSGGDGGASYDLISAFLPTLGAGARIGSAWEDTLPISSIGGAGALSALSGSLSGNVLRSIAVTKDTTFQGEAAWKLETGTEIRGNSAGARGLPLQIDASGGGRGFFLLSKTGTLLYATDNTSLVLNIRMGPNAAPIPIEATTVRTLTRLR